MVSILKYKFNVPADQARSVIPTVGVSICNKRNFCTTMEGQFHRPSTNQFKSGVRGDNRSIAAIWGIKPNYIDTKFTGTVI